LSVIFHGDGVPEEGAWNEAANFAAINKLPILFVCENNLYCTHQPLEERRLRDNLPELARAHGLESVSVDGNNVVEVYRRTREIARKVRDGEGPFFLECRTYRWLGHVGPRDNLEVGLRSEDEIGAWKERCPIGTFSRWLVDSGTFTQEKIERLRDEVASKVESAVEFAEQSVSPGAEEVLENVFMTQGRHS
jgi:pyruvate dehydrogenase E1 component alpha subunit